MDAQKMVMVSRMGYLGNLSKRIEAFLTGLYDQEWGIGYTYKGEVLSHEKALQHYEDSYRAFFMEHPDQLEWLVRTASDVYDTAESNVHSGLNYAQQETERIHLQDIALRRVVAHLNEEFRGDHLVEVRGKESEGSRLSPGVVPFHEPDAILQPSRKGWWNSLSIEDFWQSNKMFQLSDMYLCDAVSNTTLELPADACYVKQKELDQLMIVFSSYQKQQPTFFALGKKADKTYHLIINPDYKVADYVSQADFYQQLIDNPANVDFVLRASHQLPKGTFRKLRYFAREILIMYH